MASCAPQKPAAQTTMSASMTPSAVRTPGDPAALVDDADHLGVRNERGAAGGGSRGLRLDGAHRLGQPVGRGVEPTEDAVGVEQRVQRDAFVRGSSSLPSIPHAAAQPALRCRSAERSGVVATSRPPTWLNTQPSRCSSAQNFSMV